MKDPIRDARDNLIRRGLQKTPASLGNVPEVVERSWRRSLGSSVPSSREPEFLHEFDPESLLRRAALPVLGRWREQLSDTGTTLFLSDRSGQIIARRSSDRTELHRLDSVFAAEGFNYAEEGIGTNALGTSLIEKSAVFIRGAEHFIDMLQVNACAAAPVFAPNGSAVGSIALSCSSSSASPLMLSMVKEVGQQIEHNLRSATRPQDLAVALSFTRYGSSVKPTVVMDQATVLANTPGLPYVTVDTHVMLWELFQDHDWKRSPQYQKDLQVAGLAIEARRLGDDPHAHYVVHFSELTDTSNAQAIKALGPVAESPQRGSQDPSHIRIIAGPQGSGRYTRFQELMGLDQAIEIQIFNANADTGVDLSQLELKLSSGEDVLLRRAEELSESEALKLARIIRSHQQLAVNGSRTSVLWITSSLHDISPALSSALGNTKDVIQLKSLEDQRDRIPYLVRNILDSIDTSAHRIISPGALQAMTHWHWPGNLSELKEVLECALDASAGSIIEIRHLPKHIQFAMKQRRSGMIRNAERDAIIKALESTEGNKSEAAGLLGIGRTTLYRKMRQYRIDGDEGAM